MLPTFGWGIPSGSPTEFWAWQTVWAVRLRQAISADLGSIHVDGSRALERRLTLRVLGCRTDFGSRVLCSETKHAPPRTQPLRSPPATGPPAAMALLAYRACGKVVTASEVQRLRSSSHYDLLAGRADRERYYTPPKTCSSVTST